MTTNKISQNMSSVAILFQAASSWHIKKERVKARKLRTTKWWKNRLLVGVCYFCKKRFSPTQLTMEHLIPLSRGGLSIKNNVVTACKSCNSKKKHSTIVEERLKELK